MPSDNEFYTGKIIWITGASSGIGRALAIALSQYACTLYLSARNQNNLLETQSVCLANTSAKATIHLLAGDLSVKTENQSICDSMAQQQGRLDIAILNAGTCEYVDIDRFDSDLFKRLMDINFMAMVYGIEAALPMLKQSSCAQLIGMSSTAAYLGIPRSEAYGATKAAIYNMFKALAVSLKPHNISSSVICPGFVTTELTAKNTFSMPALITAESAAKIILTGIKKHHPEIHFPKRFSWSLKFISFLPISLQYRLLAKTIES